MWVYDYSELSVVRGGKGCPGGEYSAERGSVPFNPSLVDIVGITVA